MTDNAVKQALDVMQRHITALNASDNAALTATLHFPHFRLNGVQLKTWSMPADYFSDFLQRAGSQWSHSAFEDIQVLQSSDDKVHLDVEVRRFRADNTLITSFRSLWVITRIDDVWAVQLRSSFATK